MAGASRPLALHMDFRPRRCLR